MAALAAQTGVGNASTFVGRVPATIIGAPSAWGLTAESAFVLAFAGGDLPQPAAAFAVYTNGRAVVASDAGRGRPAFHATDCLCPLALPQQRAPSRSRRATPTQAQACERPAATLATARWHASRSAAATTS